MAYIPIRLCMRCGYSVRNHTIYCAKCNMLMRPFYMDRELYYNNLGALLPGTVLSQLTERDGQGVS